MSEDSLFFGGMPTGPDVKKLNDRWPEPKQGDRFSYSEIERTIGISRNEGRFHSITNAWRADLQSKGFVSGCERGKAFFIQTDKQVIKETFSDFVSVQKKFRRRRMKLSAISPEKEELKQLRDHAATNVYKLECAMKEAKNTVSFPNVTTLPVKRDIVDS